MFFFFSSRRRHTRLQGDWSSDVCSSDLDEAVEPIAAVDDVIAAIDDEGMVIGAHDRVLPDAAREDAAQLAAFGFLNRDQTEFDLHAGIGVIVGDAADAAMLDQIDPAVADVTDVELI